MLSARPWIVRGWRLLALVAAAWLLHVAAEKRDQIRPATISLEQARQLFPEAAKVSYPQHPNGPDEVFDQNDRLLGFVAKTSPQADSIIGYAGPNNVLVGLSPSGRIVGLELISSADTEAHVADVKEAEHFWKQFQQWTPSHQPMPRIEGVAGSTLTSLGIAEAIQKRLAGRVESLRFPEPVTLQEVRSLFPLGETFNAEASRPGWYTVKDQAGQSLGSVVRTSPYSDFARGHSGPTESLVAVAADGKTISGIRLRRSYDTDDYLESVREDSAYLRQLTQFNIDEWARLDLKKSGLEGVSGATETSFAVAEGIRRRFAAEAIQPALEPRRFKTRDAALIGIVLGSLIITFSKLRGKPAARLIWQVILIGGFGLWFGDLLSLALLVGWARNGVAWQIAPSLVLVAAVALSVPWATRRQIYCFQLCPHGAAQEWLGRFPKLHIAISPAVEKRLRLLPGALLGIAFLIALTIPGFDLAGVEPFDAWAMRGTVLAATVIAILGLIASLFFPMGYCRFGCPTGALLKFIRSTGSNDRFGWRDGAAGLLLFLGAVFVFVPWTEVGSTRRTNITEIKGQAFGTTWNIRWRGEPADGKKLQSTVSAELERIESSLSHWRSNSAVSRFNLATTTQPIEMPAELVQLVARALEISAVSEGAFDITVAPLVQAWGFGPDGVPPEPPAADEIVRLHSFTGWQKLRANTNRNTLQKAHAQLQIDLGAILQGYAIDRLADLLAAEGPKEFLVNVGGELRARGQWRVAVENPSEPQQPFRIVLLENASLATSGTYRTKRSAGDKRWSHLIDPSTGYPTSHQTTLVSVLHSSSAMSDAWATALLVLGKERAESIARSQRLSAFIVTGGNVSTVAFPPEPL